MNDDTKVDPVLVEFQAATRALHAAEQAIPPLKKRYDAALAAMHTQAIQAAHKGA